MPTARQTAQIVATAEVVDPATGLTIEVDPSSTTPGDEVTVDVEHPHPLRWANIRLGVTIGTQTPVLGQPGVSKDKLEDEAVTFRQGQGQAAHPVLAVLLVRWWGVDLGSVTVQSDRRTLKATLKSPLAVARVIYVRRVARWTVTADQNCTQGIYATSPSENLSGDATVTYDDGQQHRQGQITLVADPSDPGVGEPAMLYLYAALQKHIIGKDAQYTWTATLGDIDEVGIEDEEIVGESVTIRDGQFDVEHFVVPGSETFYAEPGQPEISIENVPAGSNHFTANVEDGLGRIDYTTKRQVRSIVSNERGSSLVLVRHATDEDRQADVVVQWGQPEGPKDITLNFRGFSTGNPCGAGLIVTLVNVGTGTTDAAGAVTFHNVDPGTYALRVHDPAGNFQDNYADFIPNDWITVV